MPAIDITGMPYVPGSATGRLQFGLRSDPAGKIVVLDQPPSVLNEPRPAGFVLLEGSPFSHNMIPLLGGAVPTVLISRSQADSLRAGMSLHIDGELGRLIDAQAPQPVSRQTDADSGVACTADGTAVSLRVSARSQRAVQKAVTYRADAIGLVRSEFLIPENGVIPDADFYRDSFTRICEAAHGMPVTIRLFDIAASKRPPWLSLPATDTGVLGRQGVRLYADAPVHSVYRAQLKAINDLPTEHDIRILLPYVADYEQLRYWRDDIRAQLNQSIPIGAMAETPAAALQIREWLALADFVAIGCNDLMQCLFGADRDLPLLHRYLDPYSPSLYRFLRQTADQLQTAQLETVQLCGVLPQLPGILPVLLGLGFRAFSVEAAQLPYLRRSINNTDIDTARRLADQACKAGDSESVRSLINQRLVNN